MTFMIELCRDWDQNIVEKIKMSLRSQQRRMFVMVLLLESSYFIVMKLMGKSDIKYTYVQQLVCNDETRNYLSIY